MWLVAEYSDSAFLVRLHTRIHGEHIWTFSRPRYYGKEAVKNVLTNHPDKYVLCSECAAKITEMLVQDELS